MKADSKRRDRQIGDKLLTVGDVTRSYRDWARPLGLASTTLYNRIHRSKMDPADAVAARMVSARAAGQRGRKAAVSAGAQFGL
jgi:hypothetical protein